MKRTCKKVRKKLPALLSNQLDREEATIIEQHLSICPLCRIEEEDLRATWNLLENYSINKEFPDLSHRVLERIEGKEEKASFFQNIVERFTLIPAPALYILILLLGIPPGILLGKNLYPTLSGFYPHYQRGTQSAYTEEIPWDIFSDLPRQSLGDVYLNVTTDSLEEEQ